MIRFSTTLFFISSIVVSLSTAAQKQKVDLLIYNATVYTVDKNFSTASAVAVLNGKIEAVGNSKTLLARYDAAERYNAIGKFIYPGFIDAHSHFLGYGFGLQTADLVGTTSWEDVLIRLKDFAATQQLKPGEWLRGRGWDQNDWNVKEYPSKEKLDELFPQNPVLLTRVDGHAAIVNEKAIQLSGVAAGQVVDGGEIVMKNGKLTGVLVDNAIRLVSARIPSANKEQFADALMDAQQNCFAVGLTTVTDCGVSFQDVLQMDSLQKKGDLKMKVYAMLSDHPANYAFASARGKIKTPYLSVRSFKVYADGALGSRGAALLHPYSDRPDWSGFLLSSHKHFDSVAAVINKMDFQMCTHAIGDSGNRTILNIYGKYLQGKNDKRWRIEHAQVVNKNDFHLFGRYSVVPSVQPTHATSDMYWAGDRLGSERLKGAYAFRQLMNENGWIPLGTDFPVEDISTFKTFYAAVFRVDEKNWPGGGFQMENALTRKEALQGMTIWAAKSLFEENEKGSLEKGKYADIIVLDKDIMKVPSADVLQTKVIRTFVNGKQVYAGK